MWHCSTWSASLTILSVSIVLFLLFSFPFFPFNYCLSILQIFNFFFVLELVSCYWLSFNFPFILSLLWWTVYLDQLLLFAAKSIHYVLKDGTAVKIKKCVTPNLGCCCLREIEGDIIWERIQGASTFSALSLEWSAHRYTFVILFFFFTFLCV